MDTDTNWSSGYVTDVGYVFGYYNELSIDRLKFALLVSGIDPIKIENACELGFGQGLSININAACSNDISWYGTDFNQSQTLFAKNLGEASGASIQLFDDSFEEFCSRDDIPNFDYIGLHGIWSWISDKNRHVIVDFIRRKLNVGGILYISYNALPGWGQMYSLRHLMVQYAEKMCPKGQGTVPRINTTLEFVQKLLKSNSAYGHSNPNVAKRVDKMLGHNREYLAHEYFNKDWAPMHFADMVEWLAPAKMEYACSAHFPDNIDSINYTEEQRQLLGSISDPSLRESVRDILDNKAFRRDIWVKGARRINPLESFERLRQQHVMAFSDKNEIEYKLAGPILEVQLNKEVYSVILDAMPKLQPTTLGKVEKAAKSKNIDFAKIVQAILILYAKGDVVLVHDDATRKKYQKTTDCLNSYICSQAHFRDDVHFLASPLSGGGVNVSKYQQLFMLAGQEGLKTPLEYAEYVWKFMELGNQRLIKDQKPLESPEENIALLATEAETFMEKVLPRLKALHVA